MSCSNVTSPRCLAPANLESVRTPRTSCYHCGERVCPECSNVMGIKLVGMKRPSRRRICDNCLDELHRFDDISHEAYVIEMRIRGYDYVS